jgi:hypothetical protein
MKITVGKLIKALIPYGIVYVWGKFKRREKMVRFGGLYPEKVFYIIRRPEPGAGLFSNFHWVLGHIIYALEKNYVPVVDMQNYKTFYSEQESLNGTKNAWEYYFKQPMSYTLEHAYKGKNVILSAMDYLYDRVPFFVETEEQITRFHDVVSKYMQFNAVTLEVINTSKSQLFADKENILGVLYRGTDYTGLRPKQHSIMASIDDYINKVHECLEKWGINWIYLMTEDMKAIKMFEKEFSNKLVISDSKRIDNYNPQMGLTPNIRFDRKYDNYYKGLEYIRDTVLLSYCDALIGSKVNGTMAAVVLNNNRYKNKYIFSLGVYQ